ncbi:MAG: DegT/DnrJ/EryC1/StrS family aminotransferase [Patescibacteria group bacterium]
MKIEFFKHNLDAQDKKNLLRVLDSPFLTTGETVAEFEKQFAKYMYSKFTVGVMSCTEALHLCLVALGIGKDDEVITTPLSFIATANSIEYAGAKPVFVDVEPKTGNMDAAQIERAITKKTKAIMPVHLYGQMCDMKTLAKIAKRHHLKIIEDCAHSIESKRDGIRPGKLSDAACFSFYATKNMTCGEGGAITTNNSNLAQKLKILRLHGMNKSAADRYTKRFEHYDMEVLGFKENMSNIQAALLLHQLDQLDKRWKERQALVKQYDKSLRLIPGIQLLKILPHVKSAYHLYTFLVKASRRDKILHHLQDADIGVAVNFRPIHLMKYYRKKYGYTPGKFPQAEKIGQRTITLPLYPKLKNAEQQYVIKTLRAVMATNQ